MDYSNFFEFSTFYIESNILVETGQIDDEMHYVYGEAKVDEPIVFDYYMGKKIYDVIDTDWVSGYLISDRIKTALEENDITGWKTYPVDVRNNKGKPIAGYSLLAVTGRSGPIDDTMSEVILKDVPIPLGGRSNLKRGLYFDLATWDKSDIFIPEGSLSIIVTSRVKDILEDIEATNVRLRKVSEVETEVL